MANQTIIIAYTVAERRKAEAKAEAEGHAPPKWGTHRMLYFNSPTPLQRRTMMTEGFEPTPADIERKQAAERKRRRKHARNLGHPPPKGYTMMLDDDTVLQSCLWLEGSAGWGHPNADEVGKAPPAGALLCQPA